MLQTHTLALLGLALAAAAGISVDAQNRPARPNMPIRDPGATNAALPVGSAAVSGTVVVAGSGTPARRARVTLSAPDTRSRTATTDEQGRFAFPRLPAGRYSLSATKPGHIAGAYGQPRAGRPGTPIQLADGQKFDARLEITRGSVLTGTVLDEDGEPLPGTQVRALRSMLQNGQRTLQTVGSGATDDRGIYRIYGLQPGDYVVGATPRNQGDMPPVEAMRTEMAALRQQVAAGGRGDGSIAREMATRIATLQGAMSEAEEAPSTGYAPVYYPGTTALAQAGPIALAPGEERGGLDFQLQRVPVARIEGVVVNSTAQPTQNIQVMLMDLTPGGAGIGTNAARADNEGRFRFSNVAPGQYRLAARAVVGERGAGRAQGPLGQGPLMPGRAMMASPDQVRLWASLDLTVDGRDLSNVALSLQPGVAASGRVIFQGTTLQPPADLTRLRVTLVPADAGPAREMAGPANGRVDTSGKFTIGSVTPGRYRLTAAGAPQGWVLESAMVEGQDSLDFPFEVKPGQNIGSATVTFSDQRSELSGAVVDSTGQPVAGYTLILFPTDDRYRIPQSRRIRTARPATDGQFTFGSVPPGEYKIAPVVDAEPGAWFDPEFLRQLDSSSLRVAVAEGEKKVQNVRLSAPVRSP